MIAGNHDVSVSRHLEKTIRVMLCMQHCLDEKMCLEYYGPQPEVSRVGLLRKQLTDSHANHNQLVQRARAMVRGLASQGLYYLEHESLHFTSPSGKVWKIYGSPVSDVLDICTTFRI